MKFRLQVAIIHIPEASHIDDLVRFWPPWLQSGECFAMVKKTCPPDHTILSDSENSPLGGGCL